MFREGLWEGEALPSRTAGSHSEPQSMVVFVPCTI